MKKGKKNAELVQTQEEMLNKGINWFAYFKGSPTKEDLRCALEKIYGKDTEPEEVFYDPERMDNKFSKRIGQQRWYICQSV